MSDHAKLGPSSAHRWMRCPGSRQAEEGLSDTDSEFAREGTMAHELAALCLIRGSNPTLYIGERIDGFDEPVTREMAQYVLDYIDYVLAMGEPLGIEQELSYDEWVPEGFGTVDAIRMDGTTLHVIDLKYGKGVKVEAENNEQGLLYALGTFQEYGPFMDIKKIMITIHQPRLENVSTWELTVGGLLAWGEEVKKKADKALEDDAPRIPGEKQCRWCKAKPTCPALYQITETALDADFKEMSKGVPSPGTLTDQQLDLILSNKKLIKAWLKDVEKHVTDRIMVKGENFPGWKMVNGKSNRAWNDYGMAERKLIRMMGKRLAYSYKLLTPTAAEKALGKEKAEKIQKLITKPPGKPVLVPEDDKRSAIQQLTDEDFNF